MQRIQISLLYIHLRILLHSTSIGCLFTMGFLGLCAVEVVQVVEVCSAVWPRSCGDLQAGVCAGYSCYPFCLSSRAALLASVHIVIGFILRCDARLSPSVRLCFYFCLWLSLSLSLSRSFSFFPAFLPSLSLHPTVSLSSLCISFLSPLLAFLSFCMALRF